MRYQPIDPKLFIDNRTKLKDKLKPNSIAIFYANDEMPRNGDLAYKFRQNSDLFYLTGIDQEETMLIIFPDSPIAKYREVLFVKRTDEQIAIWEGEKYTQEQASETSGIETVLWNEHFEKIRNMLINYADTIYLNLNENDRAQTEVPNQDLRAARDIQESFPLHNYERLGPVMSSLRSIKSQLEIDQMQKAVSITDKAFRTVLDHIKPGLMEYEIEALISYEFTRHGANGFAYEPIVASGQNACVLHYTKNDKQCRDGDLVLMDFGAEYANYAADITRTIPVNGCYTKRQKEVYNAVLKVMKEAMQMLTPGTILSEYNQEVGKLVEKELVQLGILSQKDIDKQDPDNPLFRKYFMHGTSHFIGLDTHDIGNRYEPIQAGMAFTVEPGIYLRDEKIGVRIENDVIVTDNGVQDLAKDIPVEAEEIEELMKG